MEATGRVHRLGRRVILGGGAAAAAAGWSRPGTAAALPGPGTAGADGAGAGATAVAQWNAAALQAIRAVRPAPTVAARALAVLHTCVFAAWAVYDATAGTRLGGAARRPWPEHTAANKREAVSYAAHRALVDLFPTEAPAFGALLRQLGYPPPPPGEPGGAAAGPGWPATPREVGEAAAGVVLFLRRRDGANQDGGYADTSGYVPVNTPDEVRDPNRWQPLRLPSGQVQQCTTPHWGTVRPFALTSGAQLRPAGPARSPSDAYRTQAVQLLELSAGLTDRHKAIAEYWSDGPATETPPGHWCLLAQGVALRDRHDLDADVKLFFALANALLDAGIAAWDAKRHFDSVRPITAIRYLFAGRPVRAWGGPGLGTVTLDGATWQPYQLPTFVTPPFPEYVSGHSTFSAAAAEVLRRFTGSDAFRATATVPAGSSRIEPGRTPAADVILAWPTFSAAADEAGLSRRYGGIHFEHGDLHGRALGRAVGAQAWARAQAYATGVA